jgi:anti-sigma regulatory factor (Ser/Thr protein kinase)
VRASVRASGGSWVEESADLDVYAGVSTVLGRHRRPSDVVGDLMDVLAGEARIVVCDLEGLAAGAAVVGMFAPVSGYLTAWPGTAVVARVPAPRMRGRLRFDEHQDRLLVRSSWIAGVVEADQMLPPVQHRRLRLAPLATGVRDARAFAAQALQDWRLPHLVDPAALVVSELVTNSILHAATTVCVSLNRADGDIRVAVSDESDDLPASHRAGHPADDSLCGRGLLLVQALSRDWGVFPSRSQGKTVWSVLGSSR